MKTENNTLNRFRNITLLLVSTMTVMAGATLAPALPDMKETFSDIENIALLVKLTLTVPGIVIALMAPLVGILLDRWNKKKTLILATILYGISGTAGYFLSSNIYAILVSRVILGVAVSGIMVGSTTLVGDYFEGINRNKFMGLKAAFGAFGGVLFLFVGGLVADIHWTMPFFIYTLAFILLPLVIFFIVEPAKKASETLDNKNATADSNKTNRLIGSCYFLGLFEILILYMIPVHFPFFIKQLENTSNTKTGVAIAAMMLSMALTSALYKQIKRWGSFQLLHLSGMFIMSIGFILLGFSQTYANSIVCLLIAGVGFGIMRPNLVVWLMSFTAPALRGRIMGGLTTFFFLGQFICPIITQPIINKMNYSATFQYSGIAVLLLTGIFAFIWAPAIKWFNLRSEKA